MSQDTDVAYDMAATEVLCTHTAHNLLYFTHKLTDPIYLVFCHLRPEVPLCGL
jgi:hypothetical protein